MSVSEAKTLVAAFDFLPDDPDRGFRFFTRDRKEHFLSFKEMEAEAVRRAAHLRSLGLKPGDRIPLVLPEPYEFVLSFLGCSVAGLVPVPVSPQTSFKSTEGYVDVVAHILNTAGARIVLCMEGNRPILEPLQDRSTPMESLINVESVFEGTTPAFERPEVRPDDLCFLQFTSGSTSKPKGVMVTHANLTANANAFLGPRGLDIRQGDHAIAWLPLFHDMGLIGFALGTLLHDLPATLIPTERFARSPRIWLETISKYRGTITYAPNFAYQLVTKRVQDRHLADLELSQLRVAGCGAEPIRAQTLLDFAEKFAPCGFKPTAFVPSYGMAEATLAITFHQLGTELKVDRVDGQAMKDGVARPAEAGGPNVLELVSCGEPFPGHEMHIIDEAGQQVGERQVGEIITRGPSVTAGYFENPEATAETWKDGWLHTGDLGYVADGNLYICGRIKDLIIIRGANHYPQDIEWMVGDLDGVRRGNVVAFSVMQDGTEELIVAAEAHSGDADRLREEITAKVMQEFGLATRHVAIVAVGTLPKTSSGKAQRRKAKAMFEEGTLPEHPVKETQHVG